MAHQCAAIPHTWCKNAKRPCQNLVLPRPLFPCPICAQRRPRITKSSGLCSRAQTVKIKSTPRAASCLLMGSRPQWPPFGAKPRNCKYSYGVSPGFPPGSFYPPPRSAAAQGTMIRCILLYVQNTTPGSNCQYLFPSLPLFRNRPPKNPHREAPLRRQVPEGGGCGCGPAPS